MEYKRVENSGIIEMWKNDKMIGHIYSIDELWKRRVYLAITGELKSKKADERKRKGA